MKYQQQTVISESVYAFPLLFFGSNIDKGQVSVILTPSNNKRKANN